MKTLRAGNAPFIEGRTVKIVFTSRKEAEEMSLVVNWPFFRQLLLRNGGKPKMVKNELHIVCKSKLHALKVIQLFNSSLVGGIVEKISKK